MDYSRLLSTCNFHFGLQSHNLSRVKDCQLYQQSTDLVVALVTPCILVNCWSARSYLILSIAYILL